jgi:hypothetical protein
VGGGLRSRGDVAQDLVDDLERGGGNAERAAAAIARTRPEGAARAVAKVARSASASDDARAWAARCLGDLGDPSAVDALADLVVLEKPARLVREAAVALRKLAGSGAAEPLAKATAAWGAAHDRRLVGGAIDYPDWEEVCATLADLVEALAVCGPAAETAARIERAAVRGVLEKRDEVRATARAGQDPSRPRRRLAEAVGRAYATLRAPEPLARTLEASVQGDAAAVEAARRGAESPFARPSGSR